MRESVEVDMSPEAIDQRLREISQLRRLGLSFRDLRDLGRAEDLKEGRFKLPPSSDDVDGNGHDRPERCC